MVADAVAGVVAEDLRSRVSLISLSRLQGAGGSILQMKLSRGSLGCQRSAWTCATYWPRVLGSFGVEEPDSLLYLRVLA